MTNLSVLNKKDKITVHMAKGEGIHFFFFFLIRWSGHPLNTTTASNANFVI